MKSFFLHDQKFKTKVYISWEQKEPLRWNKKHFKGLLLKQIRHIFEGESPTLKRFLVYPWNYNSLSNDQSFLAFIKGVDTDCIVIDSKVLNVNNFDWSVWIYVTLWNIINSLQLSITQYLQSMLKNVRHV